MLAWRSLTRKQKAACLFLLVLLVVGGPLCLVFADSTPQRLYRLGGCLCFLAVLLDPQYLRVSVTSAIDPRSTPRQSLILMGTGVPLVLLGLLYQWILVSHS
jgi:hypothetical protein